MKALCFHNKLQSQISYKNLCKVQIVIITSIWREFKDFVVCISLLLQGKVFKMQHLEIRPASEDDFSAVVKLSRATFEDRAEADHDYIPNRFNDWLVEPKRSAFVAVIKDRVVGFRTFAIVNEGKSSVCEAEMIHPDFRRDDLQIQLIEANREFIRKNYPNVSREFFYAPKQLYARRKELFSDQMLFKQDTLAYYINQATFNLKKLNDVQERVGPQVRSCSREEFEDEIISGMLFPKEIFTADGMVLEASRANVGVMLKEGDKVLVDVTEEDEPFKSFSHGRLSRRNELLHWECNVYARHHLLFQVHVLEHVKFAAEVLSPDNTLVIVVHFLADRNMVSSGRKLLEGILCYKPCDCLNLKQNYVHKESIHLESENGEDLMAY